MREVSIPDVASLIRAALAGYFSKSWSVQYNTNRYKAMIPAPSMIASADKDLPRALQPH
jgi:hypothetical protein